MGVRGAVLVFAWGGFPFLGVCEGILFLGGWPCHRGGGFVRILVLSGSRQGCVRIGILADSLVGFVLYFDWSWFV